MEEEEGNWVAMEMGHLLEDMVAEIFHRKTGYEIYQIKKMFAHPQYPFMLADVDYFITLPDGKTAILEIKTTEKNMENTHRRYSCLVLHEYGLRDDRSQTCIRVLPDKYKTCSWQVLEFLILVQRLSRRCTTFE